MEQKLYHYKESGLDNVYLVGIAPEIDDAGEEIITIPFFNELHKMIAESIVAHNKSISGAELRYLRTEMELWQEGLAEILHKDKQTIGRWERNETPIDSSSEAVIRRLAIEKLGLDVKLSMEELLRRCQATAEPQLIRLRFANDNYQLLEDAA